MKWKDLSGEERYRVVQMARKGEVPVKELCKTFGVSRQSLKVAMEKVDLAAMEALEPKSPGRKGRTQEQTQISAMKKEKTSLEKEVGHWKMKYEIAMTFVDLHKKILNGEPLGEEDEEESSGKKKKRRRLKKPKRPQATGPGRTTPTVAESDDG
jgi:transposase-like protein